MLIADVRREEKNYTQTYLVVDYFAEVCILYQTSMHIQIKFTHYQAENTLVTFSTACMTVFCLM